MSALFGEARDERCALECFVWTAEMRKRQDGCYVCTEDACSCAADAEARGCWSGDIAMPTDSFSVKANPPEGSDWRQFLSIMRGDGSETIYKNVGNSIDRHKVYGCEVGVTGTFQRSAIANQDPMFYVHHAFTFVVLERAMRRQRDSGASKAPYYNLDAYAEMQTQCGGHNLWDVSVFSNLVPYAVGQEPGSRHTWAHILTMWGFERRHYRWVDEGEA